jgi:hypothetical protein
MAIPVISNTTSVLGFRKKQEFAYQPYASNTPTSWTATGLPTGVTINTTTGLISGAATIPGVYVVSLTASNATGPSTPHQIAIGIEDGPLNDSIGIEINVDVRTGYVAASGQSQPDPDKAVLFAKRGDVLFLDVGFWRDDVLQDLPIADLKFQMREFDGETILVASNGLIEDIGTSDAPRYRIAVDFNGSELDGVLGGYESDLRTGFLAIAELQWILMHGSPALPTAETATRSSQTFRVHVQRDLIPNS